jgi:pimeloyl-ACP methyl ester carboxylesterase
MSYHVLSDGTRIFFTDYGEGSTPVLFVHGWTCDSHDWTWQIPAFTERYRVIAPDLRGHGRSSVAAGGYTCAGFADDLASLLTALGSGPAVVIGHSLGGAIAAHLAVNHPDLVRAVVAVDSSYGPTPGDGDVRELIAAQRSPHCHDVVAAICTALTVPSTPAALLTWYQRRGAGTDPEVIAATTEGLLNEEGGVGPTAAFLRRRAVPVLAVHRTPANAGWEAATLRADGHSEVLLWEGLGHWLHQEQPGRFNHAVLGWLDRVGVPD